MNKEKFITIAILVVLGFCLFLFSGCRSKGDDMSLQDLYVAGQLLKMETKSDCLTCLGCSYMVGPSCGFEGTYYGCIDCFGITVNDDDSAEDMFWEKKIYGGLCGTSCFSCYWVNFPMFDAEGNAVPVYGCMSGG